MIGFLSPLILPLTLLSLLPWIRRGEATVTYSSLELIPTDALSTWLDRFIRLAGSLAIFSIVVGMAGPYQREKTIERMGTGAHIVLL